MSELERVSLPERADATPGLLPALHAVLMRVDDQRKELVEQGDVDSLALGWARFKDFMRSARALMDQMEQDVASLMDGKLHEVPDLGTLERRRSKKRTEWDHRKAAQAVVVAAMEAGEINHPKDVIDALLACMGASYWRVGEMKRRGLDVADYCHEEPGRPSVFIHGQTEEL